MERFTNKQTADGSEVSLDDNFSSIGLFDDADEISSLASGHTVSALRLRYCDTYQLRLCVTSVVVSTLPATVVRSHDSMDVDSLSVQIFPLTTNFANAKCHAS